MGGEKRLRALIGKGFQIFGSNLLCVEITAMHYVLIQMILSNHMTVPAFSANGVLPPFVNGNPTEPNSRSPYIATMEEIIDVFCTSAARARLLKGLNEYRKHLFQGGFVTGYQWLDGSFVENVELLRGRPPSDIDVVTLFHRPVKYQADDAAWVNDYRLLLHNQFFNTHLIKPKYNCDTYAIDMDAAPKSMIRSTTYWFGLFSDIRGSSEKKGIVEVPLANNPSEFAFIDGMIGGKFDV